MPSARLRRPMVGIVGYGAYIPRHRIGRGDRQGLGRGRAELQARGWAEGEVGPGPGPGRDHPLGGSGRTPSRARASPPQGHRRRLRRLRVAPLRGEAHRHRGGRGHRRRGTNCTCATSSSPARPAPRPCSWPIGLVKPGDIKYGLAIGADTSQGAPGDALEYSAAAGAAAYIMGSDNVVATLDWTHSFMTDTPDFWRREYQHYPQHARPLHRRAGLLQAHHAARRGAC